MIVSFPVWRSGQLIHGPGSIRGGQQKHDAEAAIT
jgi:hypothetical protein